MYGNSTVMCGVDGYFVSHLFYCAKAGNNIILWFSYFKMIFEKLFACKNNNQYGFAFLDSFNTKDFALKLHYELY